MDVTSLILLYTLLSPGLSRGVESFLFLFIGDDISVFIS
jgi:hypothetical protein